MMKSQLKNNFLCSIAAVLLTVLPLATADGNVKSIPRTCNKPKRLYLQREVYGSVNLSKRPHEKWHIGRAPTANDPGYVAFHKYSLDERDGPWRVAGANWTTFSETRSLYGSGSSPLDDYLVCPKSTNCRGWISSLQYEVTITDDDATPMEPFGFCPGKSKADDDDRLIMWKCNMSGHYPNFYALEDGHVFFDDPDGFTYRPYVDEKKMIVRHEKC